MTTKNLTNGVQAFEKRVFLATPTMHGDEARYVNEAFETNWVSTVGRNIDVIEEALAALTGKKYAVALGSGSAAMHMAVRAAAVRLYGMPPAGVGALAGRRAFCSDLTFAASVNPVIYEGGEPVLIDSEYSTWNMDPAALELAFCQYPEVRIVIVVHLYGTPAKMGEIRDICRRHGAILIEDAAESLGASFDGYQTGGLGDIGVISFNGNKIITGSCGGALLCDDELTRNRVRKWSTQAREPVPWYQHTELGYNYRISNLVAGVIRGQLPWLEEHRRRKAELYERYRRGFMGLPVTMNPFDAERSIPNHWLSCILLDREAMCPQIRTDEEAHYVPQPGKSCPTQILETLAVLNAEGRPVWKPMHLQPFFAAYPFVKVGQNDVNADLFQRGLCLPSDIKMTEAQQRVIIDCVRGCFGAEAEEPA